MNEHERFRRRTPGWADTNETEIALSPPGPTGAPPAAGAVVVLDGERDVVVTGAVGGVCACVRWFVEHAARNETAATIAIATGALRTNAPIPS